MCCLPNIEVTAVFSCCRTNNSNHRQHQNTEVASFPLLDGFRAGEQQVWAPLIEKAFAKLHGCYESIGRGSVEQGLRCLTGAPVLRTPLMGLSPLTDPANGYVGLTTYEEASEKHRQGLWAKMKK